MQRFIVRFFFNESWSFLLIDHMDDTTGEITSAGNITRVTTNQNKKITTKGSSTLISRTGTKELRLHEKSVFGITV